MSLSFQKLERLLLILLTIISVTTLWMGLSLQDPGPDQSSWRDQSQLPVSNDFQNRPTRDGDEFLWTNRTIFPDWMRTYMDWHSSVVGTLHVDNWQNYKYLVLRCYRKDERCGGVSDRLKPVPLMLLAAHRSHRILLIDWDRPCPLQEFLITPVGGFRWGVPSFMIPLLREGSYYVITRASNLIESCSKFGSRVLYTHVHDALGGMTQYDDECGSGSFAQIYHALFRVFFQPSLSVQHLIDKHLVTDPMLASKETLVEGQYSVAHFRAEYGREVKRHPVLLDKTFLQKVTMNAIRCASELQPPGEMVPIYFASDNPIALATARQMATLIQYPIITFDRAEEKPRHLDDYDDIARPSDYYSTFVDLYLAGSGKCVTHGRGGFGRFASLLSFNVSCSSKHVQRFNPVKCKGQAPLNQLLLPAELTSETTTT